MKFHIYLISFIYNYFQIVKEYKKDLSILFLFSLLFSLMIKNYRMQYYANHIKFLEALEMKSSLNSK